MKSCSMMSTQPGSHTEVVNVGMRDHSIMNNGCFLRITRRRCWCNSVVQKQSCALCVLKNNTNVSNFISTTKIVKAET